MALQMMSPETVKKICRRFQLVFSKGPKNEGNRDVYWWEAFDPNGRILTGRPYALFKRLLDILFLLLLLPYALPLFVLIALLIKIDAPHAPILFRQKRTGKDGVRFAMYKFRTMVPNAEQLKQTLWHLNELPWPDFKIAQDPRVTPIGRFLRRTSLDELPQLLNILLGDMTLVGPRPTSFPVDLYEKRHLGRLNVTPGLTGLWQIHGRAGLDFDDRVALDLAYIERRSLMLDLVILLKTVTAVLGQRGAC